MVGKQWMTVQVLLKHISQIMACLCLVKFIEVRCRPRSWIAFDDERAGSLIELVRVGGENSGIVFAERERQTVKQLIGAVPNISVGPKVKRGLEVIFVPPSDSAVHAISRDEKLGLRSQPFNVINLRLEI